MLHVNLQLDFIAHLTRLRAHFHYFVSLYFSSVFSFFHSFFGITLSLHIHEITLPKCEKLKRTFSSKHKRAPDIYYVLIERNNWCANADRTYSVNICGFFSGTFSTSSLFFSQFFFFNICGKTFNFRT